jgi:hypothetical protein
VALVMRLQLARPNGTILTAQEYNELFSAYAMTITFLYARPVRSRAGFCTDWPRARRPIPRSSTPAIRRSSAPPPIRARQVARRRDHPSAAALPSTTAKALSAVSA